MDTERGPATAYVVFEEEAAAKASLAANMQEVSCRRCAVQCSAVRCSAVRCGVVQKNAGEL